MKLPLALLFIFFLSFNVSIADEIKAIGITADNTFIEVEHNGKKIKIERSQINDKHIKTKPCPPFCIKPMVLAPNVDTYAELELISFLSNYVKNQKGLLIDTRMKEYFDKETIPGSVNIPFLLFTGEKVNTALALLGVKEVDSTKDFSEAKTMCFFCDDSLCEEANKSISALLNLGYPADKLKYYRGGLKAWKALNFTTATSTINSTTDN